MKKIKVLHLTSSPRGIGGVERLLLDMAGKYDALTFDVGHCNLFCADLGTGEFSQALKDTGARYFEIKGRKWFELPRILFRLITLLRAERFDVLHLHMLHATILGGFAAIFVPKTKVVVTRHYTVALVNKPLLKWLDIFFTKRADRVAAISDYVKRDLMKNGVNPEAISIVHNGTDIDAFDRAAGDADFPRKEKAFLMGTVGSLTHRKGHEHLIRALPLILRENPACELVVVGEGPELPHLQALSTELRLENKIRFAGFRKDIPQILRSFDLYVHPSLFEPFGIAILEAMAARKCVVATAVEGVTEIVVDGKTGHLVPPADADRLAEAINEAISDAGRLSRSGEEGRKRVEENFSIAKTVSGYQRLYVEVADCSSIN